MDLTDFNNNHTFAKYQSFKILGEKEKYKLVLGSFLGGTAGTSAGTFPEKGLALSGTLQVCTGALLVA